jgi:hypothetical protein
MLSLLRHNAIVLILSGLALCNATVGIGTGKVSVVFRQALRPKEPFAFWTAVSLSAVLGASGVGYSVREPISDNVIVLLVAALVLLNALHGLITGNLIVPGMYTDSQEAVTASRTDDRLTYWVGITLSAAGGAWLLLIVVQGQAASLFG